MFFTDSKGQVLKAKYVGWEERIVNKLPVCVFKGNQWYFKSFALVNIFKVIFVRKMARHVSPHISFSIPKIRAIDINRDPRYYCLVPNCISLSCHRSNFSYSHAHTVRKSLFFAVVSQVFWLGSQCFNCRCSYWLHLVLGQIQKRSIEGELYNWKCIDM